MNADEATLFAEICALYEQCTGKPSPLTAGKLFDDWFVRDFIANQGNVVPLNGRKKR